MNNQLKIVFFLFLFITSCNVVRVNGQNLEDNFNRLDSVVAHRAQYLQNVQQNIDELKKTLATCTFSSDRYGICKHLYDIYQKYDPDSALYYARRCQSIAVANGLKNELMASKLDELMVLILRGEYVVARGLLIKLGPIENCPPLLKTKYAITTLEYYMRIIHSKLADPSDILSTNRKLCWNTYGKYIPRDSWAYDYYDSSVTGCKIEGRLLKRLKSVPQPSIQAAMLEVALASIYKSEGQTDKYYNALINSSINDISMGNREAQSLLYLIESPYVQHNYSRAFNYAMVCSENAKAYKDMGRSLDIVKAHAVITRAYEQTIQRRSMYMMAVISLLAVALIIIFAMLTLILKKRKKQNELVMKQEGMNATLQALLKTEHEMQNQLAQNNQRLQEELKYRNTNFVNVYMMMSRYIATMQKFKKNIYNMIVSGMIDSARKALNSTSDTEEYMQDFYHHFDKAYLSTHPDFPERLNALLQPDRQIEMSAPDTLTPEQRIYALISLGVTDSVSIANFLHYSPQTIYNYRLKTRHNAIIPEKDFADTVARLYYQ